MLRLAVLWRFGVSCALSLGLTMACASDDPASSGSSAGTNAGAQAGSEGGRDSGSSGGVPADSGMTGVSGASNGGTTTSSDPGCWRDGDGRTTLVFANACAAEVSFRGSDIAGGKLAPGAVTCVELGSDVEPISSKRYWGFQGEDPGGEHYSLAEFTFNTDFNDFDWYNISYVDAFNLPLQITPLARPSCKVLRCAEDLLRGCPSVGRFEDSTGALVACVSPNRDDAMSPVARYFESCDDAYAWSGDDQQGDDPSPMRACAGEDWQITFCPGAP